MTGYQELKSQADIDALLVRVARFHDSLVREFRIINRAYVGHDRSVIMDFRFDGQLLVQSQRPPSAIELVFSNILELRATKPDMQWSGGARFLNIGREVDTAVELNFDDLLVRAERAFHADRSDWIGKRAFLGPELPSPDAINASKLEDKWRQCSRCGDA